MKWIDRLEFFPRIIMSKTRGYNLRCLGDGLREMCEASIFFFFFFTEAMVSTMNTLPGGVVSSRYENIV